MRRRAEGLRSCGRREAARRRASAPRPAGCRRARGRAACSFSRPQGAGLIAQPAHTTVDEELDGAGGLAHGEGDVLDLDVLLELEHERGLLLSRQRLDEHPDPADLVAMRGLLLQWRAGDGKVVEVLQWR